MLYRVYPGDSTGVLLAQVPEHEGPQAEPAAAASHHAPRSRYMVTGSVGLVRIHILSHHFWATDLDPKFLDWSIRKT